jgi:hypothetical protein
LSTRKRALAARSPQRLALGLTLAQKMSGGLWSAKLHTGGAG